MKRIRYLDAWWNVDPREGAFILTYAVAPSAEHVGRTLRVEPTRVIECSRDGSETPVMMPKGGRRVVEMPDGSEVVERFPEPVVIDNGPDTYERCVAA